MKDVNNTTFTLETFSIWEWWPKVLILIQVIGIVMLQPWNSQASCILLECRLQHPLTALFPLLWPGTWKPFLRLPPHGGYASAVQHLLSNSCLAMSFKNCISFYCFLLFFFFNSALALPLLVLLINSISLKKSSKRVVLRTTEDYWGGQLKKTLRRTTE